VVTVNGEDWSPGTPLTAASFGDSVSVQAVISDDVDVSTITVKDGDQELPPNRVTVIPPGAGDQGVQTYTVAFATTLHLGDYDLTIEARDWAGRVTRFAMPVRMGVEFLADGVLIDPNAAENPVDPAATLGIRIHSPVGLTEAGFEVFLDDDPVAFSSAQTGSPADWELTLTPGLFAGDHDVRLRISDPLGGAAEWSAEFQVGSGPLVMAKEVYFYPNPVETAGGSLIYTLNRNPQKMEAHVSIYTVSGRRVLDTLIPARAGTNRWDWDLRDGRGDFVANGIYMLVMRLRGLDDTEIITDGRKRDGKEPFEVLRIAVTR
jgi:hypothetical protein